MCDWKGEPTGVALFLFCEWRRQSDISEAFPKHFFWSHIIMDTNNMASPFDISSQFPRIPQQILELQIQQQLQAQANVTYPCVADVMYIQQQFTNQAPPTLIIPPTTIPMYPGYAQVPPGPGFTVNSNTPKYTQLLAVIEEMSKDLRPAYGGSRTSSERFKRGIAQARILLRECLLETERINSRNWRQCHTLCIYIPFLAVSRFFCE